MTRGFVTIATGAERYYKLAYTLMLSYKQTSQQPMPFAIICDKENKYTSEFDDIVILENASFSYLDKIELLKIAPYDETIFIDADSIAFGDLNLYWEYFKNASAVSAFGAAMSLDAQNGWFWKDSIGSYADQISFIPRFHGGIYFIRKNELCNKIYDTCTEIKENYHQYRFAYFDSPADEPIIALATTIHNCRPVEQNGECYGFFPSVYKTLSANYYKRKCQFSTNGVVRNTLLIHFASRFTSLPLYTITEQMVLFFHRHNRQWNFLESTYYRILCYLRFLFTGIFRDHYPQRIINKIKGLFNRK